MKSFKPLRTSAVKTFLRNNRALLILILLLALFRTGYADWSPVPTGSMEPTLLPGDVVWIDKTSFGPSIPFLNKPIFMWGHPERGDIITFVPPHTDDLFVKRVIAVPGDRIRIAGARVYVNGEQLRQEFNDSTADVLIGTEQIAGREHRVQLTKNLGIADIERDIRVPQGKYFVLGDHRNNSLDSRYWGFVDAENITGKVTAIALSFSSRRSLFERVALTVD